MPARAEDAVVSGDEAGRLVYTADEHGNQIPDFSNCGYKGEGVALPDVDVVEVLLAQESGDDTRRIQSAINHVAALPEDEDGFRGTILLKHGREVSDFRIDPYPSQWHHSPWRRAGRRRPDSRRDR